jgi:hypothetical protein
MINSKSKAASADEARKKVLFNQKNIKSASR